MKIFNKEGSKSEFDVAEKDIKELKKRLKRTFKISNLRNLKLDTKKSLIKQNNIFFYKI